MFGTLKENSTFNASIYEAQFLELKIFFSLNFGLDSKFRYY